ncbi:tRNA-specific 2-thiouridylase MnmA-like [Telopea speciosissima]|uniref:tRNA-specific 2-thiouridylase MnmA-like n=1 Tax=Telopea speciosissima TaxID=54955 RepID=UPI001CC759C2|nr:tRNA-specific 2-thiouridylase MnmA-like [Telopea speciosissima]
MSEMKVAMASISLLNVICPQTVTLRCSLSLFPRKNIINLRVPSPRIIVRSLSAVSTSIADHQPSLSNDGFLEPYLSCSMPERKLNVAVLLSGGVDSGVALRLLHAAGHSCTAFYLKIWFQEDYENFWSACPWEEDLKYATAVCEQVNVPLEIVHLSEEYWDNVVSYIIEEYRSGRTPNPDVLCNTRIKFGAFLDAISSIEFDYIASGHYARVIHPCSDQSECPSILELSKDKVKDQTYFLSHLSQTQLRRLLFPLGCISKDEVRKIAEKMDLPNKDRKDSQGICFLGKIKFSEFVARHIGEMEGVLLEAETGDFLGKHQGFWFYTIGQRQGLRLPGGPWYVVEKDVKNNVVFVSRNYFSIDKRRRRFRVGSLKWFSGSWPNQLKELQCKVRHGPGFYDCSLTLDPGTDSPGLSAFVHLSEDDQGLAAGQFAAFYQGSTCLGSGVILESWDDQGFPVCAKALEIARMEDKSKLGKPVKIMVKPVSPPKISYCTENNEFGRELQNSQVTVTDSRRQASQGLFSSINVTWLQKLKEKWSRIF